MANEKKSIIEEALLEAQQIDATFKSNAKEILAHTMGSEIEEMVKESLTGSKKRRLKEDEEEETDLDLTLDSNDEGEEEGEDLNLDLDTEEGEESEEGEEDENIEGEEDVDLDLNIGGDEGEEESEETDLDLDGLNLGDEGEDNADLDLGLGLDGEEGEETGVETMDLTGASDSDVISVFKKMGPEDEIEVVNDNGTVTLKDNKSGSEYRIELNTSGGMSPEIESVETSDIDMGEPAELELGESTEDTDEVIYEIVVDTEDGDEDDASYLGGNVSDEDTDYMSDNDDEEEMEEGRIPRTLGKAAKLPNRKTSDIGDDRRKMAESKVIKLRKENTDLNTKNSILENENKELKESQEKMVDALKQFRGKLQEVAVFNSNLTYAVRLFTENSTTKEEKQEILKRLDSAKTIKESQSIYKQLVKEYTSGKAPIKESIDEKINKTASSGASQISEQSVFVHPELKNMKKLWEYSYKK